ncbi:unnamed protein product [Prunus armeniaca]|uniref:Uncharacterized protein n=1 Tax=Prunus armeniaca TaxID=36596 RepID=A0A6J5TWM4_PRUAR|nr:unnamed protein product [Prunus armeniaca]
MGSRPNPSLHRALPHSLSPLLPLSHLPPHPPPALPHQPCPPQTNHSRPQPPPLPPLPHDGRWMHPLDPLPRHPKPRLDPLLPTPHFPNWAPLLLGLHLLPLKNPRIPRHPLHHPEWLHPTADLPPRVPPRDRAGHVLPVAAHVPVLVPGGARDQRVGARAHVRILFPVRGWDPTQVEAGGDGLPDRAVFVQLRGVGSDAVPAFLRVGLLRDLGLVLQCGLQCLSFGSFR